MRSTMFRSAVALVGSLALAGAALAADARSDRRASSSAGASSGTAVSRGSSGLATAPAPRASAPAPRVLAPAPRASAPAPRISPAPVAARMASDQGHPRTAPAGSEPVGTAAPRGGDSGGGSWGGGATTSSGGTETIQSTSGGRDRSDGSGHGRAVSRGSRSRGDRSAIGTAEGRTHPPVGGGGVWDPGYWWDNPAYYYGYGGLGLGYFYYDPFWWGSGWGDPWGYGGYYGGGGGGGYSESVRRDPIGQLRLKVKPKDAQVYVDGALAGKVDDFDGTFERLDLAEGPHRVELRLEGHAPLAFDVNIIADELVTYRGKLDTKDGRQ